MAKFLYNHNSLSGNPAAREMDHMAFRKVDHKELIYLAYNREAAKDFDNFKREVVNATSVTSAQKDLVIDLTGSSTVTSPELGILIRILQNFKDSTRSLRIITTPEIRRIIDSTNISRLKNLVLYDDQKSFFSQLKTSTWRLLLRSHKISDDCWPLTADSYFSRLFP